MTDYIKHLILLCVVLLGGSTIMAQGNELQIPDVTARAGRTFSLPVKLENTADVVAVEFNITLPSGFMPAGEPVVSATRAPEMGVVMQPVDGGAYKVMMYSMTNTVINGRSGTLLTIPVAADELPEGSSHKISMSDVVLAAQDGTNISTGFYAGNVTIAKSPDLEVKNVDVNVNDAKPGDSFDVKWTVSNIGGLPTEAGWRESIYFVSDAGESSLLTTTRSEVKLAAGENASRLSRVTLPNAIGVDGKCRIKIVVTPFDGNGEPETLRDNNTAFSSRTVNVGTSLFVIPSILEIIEKDNKNWYVTLTRSGSRLEDEKFSVSADDIDARISLPVTVIIPAGESSVKVPVHVTADGKVNDLETFVLTLNNAKYGPEDVNVRVYDDIAPTLSLDAKRDEIAEGEELIFTVTSDKRLGNDLLVKISNEHASRLSAPATVTIPANGNSASFRVVLPDNNVPEARVESQLTASANGFYSGRFLLTLLDDDTPALNLKFSSPGVSEDAGVTVLTGYVSRSSHLDLPVTIELSDDSNGALTYSNRRVFMKAGEKEVKFEFGPVDNLTAEGDRSYTVYAGVLLAECSCTPSLSSPVGTSSEKVEIYDNDGPSLTLISDSNVVGEGRSVRMTVLRNTPATSALTVNVNVEPKGYTTAPASVIIPKGETQVPFTVTAKTNSEIDDDVKVSVTVEAEGHSKTSGSLLITDRSLPDAEIKSVATNSGIKAGEKGEMTVTVANRGSYELPELTEVALYESTSDKWLGSAWLQNPVSAGGEAEISVTFPTDHKPSSYSIYARVNPEGKVKELNLSNNSFSRLTFVTRAPYSASWVEPSKTVYRSGEKVYIHGHAEGDFKAGDKMEIFVINSGVRNTVITEIDEKGYFETEWTPVTGQIGNFITGACYPGLGLSESEVSFAVLGMRRTSPINYLSKEVITGVPESAKLVFYNPCPIDLRDFRVEVKTPDGIVVDAVPSGNVIGQHSSLSVDFDLWAERASEGAGWEYVYVTASAEGIDPITTTLYVYARDPRARLVADPDNLDFTVTHGKSRTVPLTLTNTGGGDASDVSFSLPSWMSVTPSRIPVMKSGESVTVELTLSPQWGANEAIRTGKIFANYTNGNPLGVPFAVEVTAAGTGVLEVEACDNYTFSLPEHPMLGGAKISLRHPATHAEMFSGVTDEDGRWSIELPEGRYLLYGSASGHQDNNWVITINPGRTTRQVVTLPIATGVKYDYTVEETTVPDEYEMKTTVKYEVNVPAPQVIIQALDTMNGDNMQGGDARLIRFMLKNVGMMRADDVRFALPQGVTGWAFEPLIPIQPFSLEAGQSRIIPILITRVDLPVAYAPGDNSLNTPSLMAACMAGFEESYSYWCGTELIENHAAYRFALKTCATAQIGSVLAGAISGGGGGGTTVVGPPYEPGPGVPPRDTVTGPREYVEQDPETVWRRSFCNPEMTQRAEAFANSLLPFTPAGAIIGPANNVLDTAIDYERSRRDPSWRPDLENDLNNLGQMAEEVAEGAINARAGNGWTTPVSNATNIINALRATADLINYANRPATAGLEAESETEPGWVTEFKQETKAMMDEVIALSDLMNEVFGDLAWTNFDYPAIHSFVAVVKQEIAKGSNGIDMQKILAAKPDFISRDMAAYFVSRLRNTALGNESDGNFIEMARVIDLSQVIIANERRAIANGYDDACDAYRAAVERYKAYLDMESKSVCASVTMQFKQSMVLTRQAFRGNLTVDNGHTSLPITDFMFTPTVRDSYGEMGTEREFAISYETLKGFEGELDGRDWTLGPQETGVATVLYVPTRFAAPEEETPWDFGGILSYMDPFTAMRVDVNLNPVTLTVKPSPVLNIDYFVQRDVLGDDPLTPEIEESVDAEFSAIISNSGEGTATDVKVVTYKPEIIDNVKGVPLSFDLTGSSLNGENANLPVGGTVATDFGNIAPGGYVTGQWWFRSNFLAHAKDYKTEYTHVSSNGNPYLSLLEKVEVHELIRSLETEDGRIAFMVNDLPDGGDLPDGLYIGTEVKEVSVGSASVKVLSEKVIEVTVSADSEGWTYAAVKDPSYGTRTVEAVTRLSDGKALPLRNFWQTDRTMIDGLEPLVENKLHLASLQGLTDTYRITFSDRPATVLEVVEITGVPVDGIARTPVRSFGVQFNKEVNADNLSADAFTLTYNGEVVESTETVISQKDATTVLVDMGNAFHGTGDYTLTVQCARITDTEGFTGQTGVMVSWTDISEGGLRISAKAEPAEAGVITPAVREVGFGEELTLVVTACEGWRFVGWQCDDKLLSSETTYVHRATRDIELTAQFVPMTYRVDISSTDGGTVSAESGIFEYGTHLTLTAVPEESYTFDGWNVNSDTWSEENPLEIIVSGELSIKANFSGQTSKCRIVVVPGWNWVSSSVAGWVAPDDWKVYKRGDYNLGHAVEKGEILEAGVMYKVYSEKYDALTIEGTPIAFNRVHTFSPYEWRFSTSWLGALTGAPVQLEEFMEASELEEGDMIVGQRGMAVFNEDRWVGDLDMILPGEGYVFYFSKSGASREVQFNGREAGESIVLDVPTRARKYPHLIPLMLQVVDEEGANDIYEVSAVCGDELRGIGKLEDGVHLINVASKGGGEVINFIIRDPRNGFEYTSPDSERIQYYTFNGHMWDPMLIGLTSRVGVDEIIASGRPVTIYTMDGIVLKRNVDPKEIRNLAPGLYVVEGITILVK